MLKSIVPVKNLFYIVWDTGPRCNFDCSYCPPRLHDKVSPHKSLEQLQKMWTDIVAKTAHRNKKYRVEFTGGEVTLNPNFLPFVQWLRENYNEILEEIFVSTNGTASVEYYKKLIQLVNGISFSSHFEFANFNKLWKNILKTHIQSVKLRKIVFVNIMQEDSSIDKTTELQNLCIKHKVPHNIVRIDEEYFGNRE